MKSWFTGTLCFAALVAQTPQPPSCATLVVGGQAVCNTAIVATHDQVHAGESVCLPSGGVIGYTCQFSLTGKALTKYTSGMPLFLIPDVDSSGGTVNVDNVGIVSLRESDGTTAAKLTHGHGYWFFYDGTVFRRSE